MIKEILTSLLLSHSVMATEKTLLIEVVELTKEKISNEIILDYIKTKPLSDKLSAQNIIELKKEKVDDVVVKSLIQKSEHEEKIKLILDNYDKIVEYNNYIYFQKTYLEPRSKSMAAKYR